MKNRILHYFFYQLTITLPILLLIFFQLLFFVLDFSIRPAHAACAQVSAHEKIKVGPRDCVELAGSGYRLTINKFFNRPCPPIAKCLWSGVGILFAHRYRGQTMQGLDMNQAFGFDITVHETDHTTFAEISIAVQESDHSKDAENE